MEKTKDRRKLEQFELQQLPEHVKSRSNATCIATSCHNFATDFISSQIWVGNPMPYIRYILSFSDNTSNNRKTQPWHPLTQQNLKEKDNTLAKMKDENKNKTRREKTQKR